MRRGGVVAHGLVTRIDDHQQLHLREGLERERLIVDANIEVLYNHTSDRVEVRVDEGKRYRCGDVVIEGAVSMSAEELVRSVTAGQPIYWKKGEPAPLDTFTQEALEKQVLDEFAAAGLDSVRRDLLPSPSTSDLSEVNGARSRYVAEGAPEIT